MISVLGQIKEVLIKYLICLKDFRKGDADKYHLINFCGNRGEGKIKLLGIYINNRLNFDYHASQLCKKDGKKLHALTRVLKIYEHFTRQINYKCLYNASVLL